MDEQRLAITLADGQTVYAEPGPEDQGWLAGRGRDDVSLELAGGDGDVEGHGLGADIVVDVEGHAMTLRLPNAADAAALRRALALGAVTATLVGAGAVASLQAPSQAAPNGVSAPAQQQLTEVPAPALHADQAEMERLQRLEAAGGSAGSGSSTSASGAADSVDVPAAAQRADRDEQQREDRLNGER